MMKRQLTDITYFDQMSIRNGLMSKTRRKFILDVYFQLQDFMQREIQTAAKPEDFAITEVILDWEKGEIAATALIDLKFKFLPEEKDIVVTAMKVRRE
jgi:hypothetical protein